MNDFLSCFLAGILIATVVMSLYTLWRNHYVLRYILRVIDEHGCEGADRLPDQLSMVLDVTKFDWSEYLDTEDEECS